MRATSSRTCAPSSGPAAPTRPTTRTARPTADHRQRAAHRNGERAPRGAPGQALIYGGIFQAPYYLTAAANTGNFGGLTNDPAPLINKWQARYAPVAGVTGRNLTRLNPLPISTSSQQVPVLISVPDSAAIPMPGAGYPVVIFQHGISGNRSAMLFVAEALANAGFACVAIDLPLHGVTQGETLPDGTTLFLGYNQAGDVCQRSLQNIANGRNVGWYHSYREEPNKTAIQNTRCVDLLYNNVWARELREPGYFERYAKIEEKKKADEPAEDDGALDDALDDLDF